MQTELFTSFGVVGSTEVAEQHDVNSKSLSVSNFDQSSTGKIIISNISTKQSESSARTSEYRNTKKRSRQNESREKREVRLEKMREYDYSKRQNETTEQREARLAKMRENKNSKKGSKTNETVEQRKARLAKMKEYNSSKRRNEPTEQREARLAKERERKRASRKRAQGEKKDNYSSHPVGEGTSNPVSNHFPNENIDELALVRKFHNSVSAGEQRKARLAKMKEYNSSKRQNEPTEQREARLAKERERKRASRKRAQGEKKDNYSSHPVGEGTSNPVSNHFPNENIDELDLARLTKMHANSTNKNVANFCETAH